MPTNYKVLGQSNPAATTLTTLYTVPAATQAIVSTIAVTNLSASSITYRIAVRPAGAAISNSHYIAYDTTLTANNSTMITIGVTLGATDVISIYASSNAVNFSAFGTEIA